MPAHDAGTGLDGPQLGTVQHGRGFVLDPFDAYSAGLVSNPNVIVSGSIGSGKSTLVKMMLDRALMMGRRVVVIDPKGEYRALAARHGVECISLGRDGWCSPFPDDDRESRELLRALVSSAQGRSLSKEEHYTLDEAYLQLPHPRPIRVLRALFDRLAPHLDSTAATPERSIALTLHRFVHGDLAGLFDGSQEPMRFEGRLVVIDVSSQWASESFGVSLLSALAAVQQVAAVRGEFGYLVLDEAWALLNDDHALRWLQGSWKLARARGLSHVLVLHRWSDAVSSGNVGSAQRERARGLLRECETGWFFRQPVDESHEMSVALGLSHLEERYLSELPKGVALVRYGLHRSIVRVTPTQRDLGFIDTDARMRVENDGE
jgi:type IV secretory pathway VirB4 component